MSFCSMSFHYTYVKVAEPIYNVKWGLTVLKFLSITYLSQGTLQALANNSGSMFPCYHHCTVGKTQAKTK